MPKVYVTPPDLTPSEQDWAYNDAVERSQSRSGFRVKSRSLRRRLVARLVYPGDPVPVGYWEVLRDLLEGGVNYLEMTWKTSQDLVVGTQTGGWTNTQTDPVPVENSASATVTSLSSGPTRSVASVVGNTITIRGYRPGHIVIRPGDFIGFEDSVKDPVRALSVGLADANGDVRILVEGGVLKGEEVRVQSSFSGIIMEPTAVIPITRKATGLNNNIPVSLVQVFEDEIPGFERVDLWATQGAT